MLPEASTAKMIFLSTSGRALLLALRLPLLLLCMASCFCTRSARNALSWLSSSALRLRLPLPLHRQGSVCVGRVSVRSQRVSGTAVSGHGSVRCALSACTSGVTYQWCLGKFSSHYHFLDKALSFHGWSVRSVLKQREGWVEGGMCLCSSCRAYVCTT